VRGERSSPSLLSHCFTRLVYLFGAPTDRWLTDVAILPLAIVPFAFGYSVLRYRLMDVSWWCVEVFVLRTHDSRRFAAHRHLLFTPAACTPSARTRHSTSGEITLKVRP
jgi:hypothetical protein